MVAEDLRVSDDRFLDITSKCDPTVARLGEAFLAPDFARYFDKEMLKLLQDARRTWV